MARPNYTTIYNGGNLVADLVSAGNAGSDYTEEVVGAPPTLTGLALPTSGTYREGTRFTVVDSIGEAKSEYRYSAATTTWVPLFDIEDIVITSVEFPTRPSAGSVLDRTIYINFTDPPAMSIASGGVWKNIGQPGIDFGPPQDMPLPDSVYLGYAYVVSEQPTAQFPLGLYIKIGGAFVGVSGSAAAQSKLIVLDLPGTLTSNQTSRPFRPPTGGTIQSVHLDVPVASTDSPTGQPVIVDIEVNGGTVFTDQATRPTVPVDAAVGSIAVPQSPTFTAFSSLVAKAEQLGSAPVALPQLVLYDNPSIAFSASSASVVRHPNAQVGDLQIEMFHTATQARVWTLPGTGGWVQWANPQGNSTSSFRLWVFYRMDDGSTGPWTFTLDAAQAGGSRLRWLYRNVHQTTPIDTAATGTGLAQSNNTFDATMTPGSITTTLANVLELHVQKASVSTTINPGPVDAGYTIVTGFSPTTAAATHAATIARATAGTFAGPTTTASASTQSAIIRMPIVGAGGGGGTRVGKDVRAYIRYTEGS